MIDMEYFINTENVFYEIPTYMIYVFTFDISNQFDLAKHLYFWV